MTNIWQYKLETICEDTTPEVHAYYYRLQQAAQETLKGLSGDTFRESLGSLNCLREKCSLLFYFLSYPEMSWFEDTEDMLAYIESAYYLTYQERFEQVSVYQGQSLANLIAGPNQTSSSYLWEMDLLLRLTQHLNGSQQQIAKAYQQLLVYYQQLGQSAAESLKKITGENFHEVYPLLLIVDAKCQLLLELVPHLLQEPADQFELVQVVEQEAMLAYQELFLSPLEWFEKTDVVYNSLAACNRGSSAGVAV